MDDTMNRLTELLSDKESLKQLSELAEMLKSGGDDTPQCTEPEPLSPPEESSGMPDLEMIAGIASLAGAMQQNDSNTELLMALRPHLGEEKQHRLDKAVKLMRLAAVWSAAKESGLINNLI